MKASELIWKLQQFIDVYGDVPVTCEDGMMDSNVSEVNSVELKSCEYYDCAADIKEGKIIYLRS